jgi:hypothetical protein
MKAAANVDWQIISAEQEPGQITFNQAMKKTSPMVGSGRKVFFRSSVQAGECAPGRFHRRGDVRIAVGGGDEARLESGGGKIYPL